VLDSRGPRQLCLSAALLASCFCSPVLVVHENWFRSLHALYRDGMHAVYSIVHEFTDAPTPGRLLTPSLCASSQHVLTSSPSISPSYARRRSRSGPSAVVLPLRLYARHCLRRCSRSLRMSWSACHLPSGSTTALPTSSPLLSRRTPARRSVCLSTCMPAPCWWARSSGRHTLTPSYPSVDKALHSTWI
jgi:hypothetical protein